MDTTAALETKTPPVAPDRDRMIDVVYRALVEYDRAKRMARDLRMIRRGEGPTIKRGTGRAAQAIHVTDAVMRELARAER